MKIWGEEFGSVSRWYIALPPLILIGFMAGLLVLAIQGQGRLNADDELVHDSAARERALDEFMGLVSDADAEERGYLLTGNASFLGAYRSVKVKIPPALDHLRDAYATLRSPSATLQTLQALSGTKLAQLEASVAAYRPGEPSSRGLAGNTADDQTSRDLIDLIQHLHSTEDVNLSADRTRLRWDLKLSNWITIGGAVLNIGLVILATVLVYGDMRRRARLATDLKGQTQELERQVAERTRELTALSTHLQEVSEQEKSALARELHDELGGLLVAARMDLSWLQQRLPTSDPAIEQRFKRIHESLSAGVDLKRRVVEELRPTLLDNMGLFTALRWQFKESCRRTGLTCTESIPEVELTFNPDAAIGVFRVAQEALMNILKHAEAKCADLAIEIHGDTFVLRITDDGKGIPSDRSLPHTSHGLASMRHRITALGGTWGATSQPKGGTVVTARIPLANMLMRDSAHLAIS
jgi:signal transduction histidine kinase